MDDETDRGDGDDERGIDPAVFEGGEFQKRRAQYNAESVRPLAFRRLIALDAVVRYEFQEHHGPAYRAWCDRLGDATTFTLRDAVACMTATDLPRLEAAARDVFDDDGDETAAWLMDMSERTARDYVAVLRYFHVG